MFLPHFFFCRIPLSFFHLISDVFLIVFLVVFLLLLCPVPSCSREFHTHNAVDASTVVASLMASLWALLFFLPQSEKCRVFLNLSRQSFIKLDYLSQTMSQTPLEHHAILSSPSVSTPPTRILAHSFISPSASPLTDTHTRKTPHGHPRPEFADLEEYLESTIRQDEDEVRENPTGV